MADRRLLPLAVAPLLIASPALPPSVAAQGLKSVSAQVVLLDTEAWGMGGSGMPIPSQAVIDAVGSRYIMPSSPIFPGQPIFPVDSIHPLFTPEGLYPITGTKSLMLDQSLAQGVQILTPLSRSGSPWATTSSWSAPRRAQLLPDWRCAICWRCLLIRSRRPISCRSSCWSTPATPTGSALRFGDPSLPPLTVPSMGVTFSGATPSETPWDTAMYNIEYDGFSDFPRYPLNFLSVLNAVLGIAFVHSSIADLSDEQIAQAVLMPVSDGYGGNTDYFMIPTENLPLLEPLRFLPILGDPLADLLQPALRVLVNLGYGNIEHGWDSGPADLSTPFGVFPNLDLGDVLTALGNGVQQGWQDFISDLGSLPSLPEALANSADAVGGFTDVVNGFSAALSNGYSALLPIADLVNALLTTLPAYNVSLFAQEIASGDLLDALTMPLAADVGLITTGLGIGLLSVASAFNLF